MSLSRPTESNPAKKFITFRGGKFIYWDKEKEENVEITTPFTFVVLDELHVIKGYHDKSKSGITSNEVRTLKDRLNVRSFKGGEICSGFYDKNGGPESILAKMEGGRYAKSIYIYYEGEICNLTVAGASLSAWIERGGNAEGVTATINPEAQTKGATEYYVPIFTDRLVEKELREKAIEADKQLQIYLDKKLGSQEIETESEDIPFTADETQPVDDDLPF